MIERKEEIQEAVEALYAVAVKLKRGETLTHEVVTETIGFRPHEGRYDHIVNRVRNRLLRVKGIKTWFDLTVGYRLLTPKEQLQSTLWHRKKASRQLVRGRNAAEYLPNALLSTHDQKVKAFLIDQVRRAKQDMEQADREAKAILTPTPVPPRVPL